MPSQARYFHHSWGLTPGVAGDVARAFLQPTPETLRAAGIGASSDRLQEMTRAMVSGVAQPFGMQDFRERAVAVAEAMVAPTKMPSTTETAQMLAKGAYLPALDNVRAVVAGDLMRQKTGFAESALLTWKKIVPLVEPRLFTPEFTETVRRMAERLRPRNLRGVSGLNYDRIDQIMAEEGIPFFLVTDAGTALALLGAPDAAGRRRVLRDRADEVFAACDEILSLCVADGLPVLGSKVRSAIAAYRDGHPDAAQALATNVLDSTMYAYETKTHREYISRKKSLKGGINGAAYAETLGLIEWYALAPLGHVYAQARGPRAEFSRHATAHRVSTEQYTSANAVQSIMLAASLLGFAQDLW